MELFRINGLSSEDLMRRGGNGKDASAFLGSMYKMGGPAAAVVEPDPTAPEEGDQVVPDKWTAETLEKVKKEALVEIAAGLGVADVKQTKEKLIEAILQSQ